MCFLLGLYNALVKGRAAQWLVPFELIVMCWSHSLYCSNPKAASGQKRPSTASWLLQFYLKQSTRFSNVSNISTMSGGLLPHDITCSV